MNEEAIEEAIFGHSRRLEAHRWIILAVIAACKARDAISMNVLVQDLEKMEEGLRQKNEASEMIMEINHVLGMIRRMEAIGSGNEVEDG
jgi:hypothetical protein